MLWIVPGTEARLLAFAAVLGLSAALLIALPDPGTGEERVVPADTIVVCAGQEPERTLYDALIARGARAHVIGGAERAAELDAMRAIDQGTRLAYSF